VTASILLQVYRPQAMLNLAPCAVPSDHTPAAVYAPRCTCPVHFWFDQVHCAQPAEKDTVWPGVSGACLAAGQLTTAPGWFEVQTVAPALSSTSKPGPQPVVPSVVQVRAEPLRMVVVMRTDAPIW